MTEKEDLRSARTESLFRDVNERIAETAERFDSEEAHFVCECDEPDCSTGVLLTVDEYDARRPGPIAADGHLPRRDRPLPHGVPSTEYS